jgi:uridine kinase
MKPFLIGIAGPSGAGKSELARLMAARLPDRSSLISLDSYYLPLLDLPFEDRIDYNFDHPEALDWDLIRSDLNLVARGEAIDEPVYLFDRYARAAVSRHVEPAPFVIVEGLFALYDAHVRSLLGARIYVAAPDRVCLERRLARDTIERGRTRNSVLNQYARTVRPMAERYVIPTQAYADLIVSGLNPLEESWKLCQELLTEAA